MQTCGRFAPIIGNNLIIYQENPHKVYPGEEFLEAGIKIAFIVTFGIRRLWISYNLKFMKKIFHHLSGKARIMLQDDMSTKDRPFHFQLLVVLILLSTVLYIGFYIVKAIATT